MSNNFRTIKEDEFEDFINECEARGFSPEEFELHEHGVIETEITPAHFLLNGKITITRGKNSRIYSTGDSVDWLVSFAGDLRKGVFN